MSAQSNALLAILDAIVEAVNVAGTHGAPGGILYSALMAHGCTLEQYQSLMDALVSAGRLRRQGERYFLTGTEAA